MKTSVIIPTHNRFDQLEEAVESINAQTILPNEVVIVDDFSDPEFHPSLLNKCLDPKINYIFLKTPKCMNNYYPPQRARSWGINNSTGDVIFFLDDDDQFLPNRIEKALDLFNSNPEVGLVYTGKLIVSDKNKDKVINKIKAPRNGILYPAILGKNFIGTISSVAIRREIYYAVNGFDNNLSALEDWDLFIRIAKITKILTDGAYLVKYTVQDVEKALERSSKRMERRELAYIQLKEKYNNELELVEKSIKNGFLARCNFSIAKAARKKGYIKAIPYIVKSLKYEFSLSPLLLLTPFTLMKKLKGGLH